MIRYKLSKIWKKKFPKYLAISNIFRTFASRNK
jgi:hypothetical protein